MKPKSNFTSKFLQIIQLNDEKTWEAKTKHFLNNPSEVRVAHLPQRSPGHFVRPQLVCKKQLSSLGITRRSTFPSRPARAAPWRGTPRRPRALCKPAAPGPPGRPSAPPAPTEPHQAHGGSVGPGTVLATSEPENSPAGRSEGPGAPRRCLSEQPLASKRSVPETAAPQLGHAGTFPRAAHQEAGGTWKRAVGGGAGGGA